MALFGASGKPLGPVNVITPAEQEQNRANDAARTEAQRGGNGTVTPRQGPGGLKYQASDGRVFFTQAEAELYQKQLNAPVPQRPGASSFNPNAPVGPGVNPVDPNAGGFQDLGASQLPAPTGQLNAGSASKIGGGAPSIAAGQAPPGGGETGQEGQPGSGTGAFQQMMQSLGISIPQPGFDFASFLGPAEQVFRQELDRLTQNDPFGNQAFLQKATDRAIGQAQGFAASARGGAGAVGGAFRQAQGVQSQLAAQGAQEMTELKAQDQRQAEAARLQAAGGLAQLAGVGVQAGIQQEQNQINAFSAGISAALQFEGLTQQERQHLQNLQLSYDQLSLQEKELLTQAAVEFQKIDAALYDTDMNYRQNIDNLFMQKYMSDNQLKAALAQIKAGSTLSTKDIVLGVMNAGAQVGGLAATKSDRRAKYDIAKADWDEITDYLGKSRGFSYKYKDPKDGKGRNWGPMAQGLKASKIGKSAVIEREDGMYVDTARMALADHAALAEVVAIVNELRKERE